MVRLASRLAIGLNLGIFGCGQLCGQGECEGETPTGSPTPLLDPFADFVYRFEVGEGAGFGQDGFPEVVLGQPEGGGEYQGSVDVLSLGIGGTIELEFRDLEIVDGEGPDFVVFENPFRVTGGGTFMEPGVVSVSADGVDWQTFPCAFDTPELEGCAGVMPVLSSSSNDIDPLDPAQAGGDVFDLAQLSLRRARYVRIEDPGVGALASPSSGFDLDAVAVLNGAPPGS